MKETFNSFFYSNDVPVQQEKGGKKKKFLRSIDPRSISDDVERTPIQAGSAARSPTDDQCATPIMATAKKNPTDRFKVSCDFSGFKFLRLPLGSRLLKTGSYGSAVPVWTA